MLPSTPQLLWLPPKPKIVAAAGIPQTNLVHHWPFQTANTTFSAGTGSATDIISGNNLTLTNVTSGTGRKAGQQAGIFDGTTSLGALASNPSITLNNAHAIFLNVNITTVGNAGGGGSSQSPFALSIDANNKLRIANDEGSGPGKCDVRLLHATTVTEVETSAAAFVSGTYVNIGYSFDGVSTITVYVNGVAVGTGAGGGFGDGTNNLVGARASPGTGNVAGQIDNVLIYNAAVDGTTAAAINAAVS